MEEEVKEESKQEGGIKLTSSLVAVCMAVFAMFLFVLCSVLALFSVGNSVFYGIMGIVMYALPLAGIIWSYLRHKAPSFEFWLNVIVFALVVYKF